MALQCPSRRLGVKPRITSKPRSEIQTRNDDYGRAKNRLWPEHRHYSIMPSSFFVYFNYLFRDICTAVVLKSVRNNFTYTHTHACCRLRRYQLDERNHWQYLHSKFDIVWVEELGSLCATRTFFQTTKVARYRHTFMILRRQNEEVNEQNNILTRM